MCRSQSLDAAAPVPVLVLVLVLVPALALSHASVRGSNLRCYYSPVLERERENGVQLIVAECPPGELCFEADGRYGNQSVLSARGCMAERDCGRVGSLSLRGTAFAMRYTCCPRHYCNSCTALAAASLTLTLALLVVSVSV